MTSDRKDKRFRIPIRFSDAEDETESPTSTPAEMDRLDPDFNTDDLESEGLSAAGEDQLRTDEALGLDDLGTEDPGIGGPDMAELIATRAELKRVEAENAELKNSLARRQADFENYRKRVDRERSETYNRVVADIAEKLLPVSDNLKRALETEASVEAAESDEFRHFLSGVDLIWKQLNGVLDALGVKPIVAVGEPFNPHLHEAVVTEASDEYEPDTVIQEIRSGYRLGDKLIRPALVKVSTRK
ncbi:MAG TPA: nucleotide exchange factor GrpE [Pyrinomonadaceae bacterium]|jgi:molecular chaperone GrpE|nr:nucleotide exchange factor GrpE [Pyrinomonadaceae bacterium]